MIRFPLELPPRQPPRQSWYAIVGGGLVFIGGVGLIALVLWLQG